MPTPSERRALLFVASVAALGLGVRGLRVLGPSTTRESERSGLAAQIAAVDSAVTSGGRSRRPSASKGAARPADPPPATSVGPIDVDRASVAELDRLPGIGPALAQRIVAEREARGPFGSLDGLQQVRGIGPALAARLAPLVTFSGPPRPPAAK